MGGHLTEEDKQWVKLLQGTDFPFCKTRMNSVARVLALNKFDKISRLKWAPHPREWMEIKRLEPEEVDFLANMAAGKVGCAVA